MASLAAGAKVCASRIFMSSIALPKMEIAPCNRVGDRSGHRAECAVCIVEVIGQGLPLAAAICRGGVQAGDQVVQGIDMLFTAKGRERNVSLFLGHVLGGLIYDPEGFGQSDGPLLSKAEMPSLFIILPAFPVPVVRLLITAFRAVPASSL